MLKTRQQSGKIRRNLSKLKTQESKEEEEVGKEVTVKTTPESNNLIKSASRPKEVLAKHAGSMSLFEQAEIL